MNIFGSKKGQTEGPILAKGALCLEESLREEMLFGVELIHASDFGIGAEAM